MVGQALSHIVICIFLGRCGLVLIKYTEGEC